MQAKRRMEASLSYRAVSIARNERLQRLFAESASGQIADRRGAPPPPRGHPLGPHALRFQRFESPSDELRTDPAALEVEPDQRIATATLCECSGARVSQALVAYIARASECLEYLVPLGALNPPGVEASVEFGGGQVAEAKRSQSEVDCVAIAHRFCGA